MLVLWCYMLFWSLLLKFWEGVVLKSYMCWSCWWMMRRGDVEVGSSPIFPGFLAPHGHIYFPPWFHVLSPLQVWCPLGYYCLCWIYVEYLAHFDNFYEIIDLWWILSEFFHHPYECLSETHWWGFNFWWRH